MTDPPGREHLARALAGRRCLLRPWAPGDEAALVRHADDPEIARHLRDAFPSPYTRADAEAWIARCQGVEPPLVFAVVVDGEPVGGVGLTPGEDIFRRGAEVGYWIGRAHWGRGLATEAVGLLAGYAFGPLDLVRLFAWVLATNPASCRVLEKAGFALEARLRSAVWKRGELLDAMLYARLRPGPGPYPGGPG